MARNLIVKPELMKAFAKAGNARFTLVSKKTKERFTYRVRQTGDKPHFVAVLTGSNNEEDYSFIGTIFDVGFRHSQKARITASAKSVLAFDWFWHNIDHPKIATAIEFWHEGRCCRCARPLTDPASIASGFGPECIKHVPRSVLGDL